MREKLKKMQQEWHMPCMTYAEEAIAIDIGIKLPEIPLPEPVTFSGIHDGKRNDAVQASLYDAMIAEFAEEKNRRLRKFERTHHADNSKKDETKADRKRNKKIRMQKMYGLHAFEDTNHGKTVFYWDTKGGQKKFTEYEAEIFRNMKDAEIEKSAHAEMLGDPEHHVGWNTVQRIMYNADKKMRKIRAEVAEGRCEGDTVETYDDSYVVIYADGEGFQHPYRREYYEAKATWDFYEYMIREYGMEYANKYAKGEM